MNLTFEDITVLFSEDSGGGEVCIQAIGPQFTRSIPVLISFENGTAYGKPIQHSCVHCIYDRRWYSGLYDNNNNINNNNINNNNNSNNNKIIIINSN